MTRTEEDYLSLVTSQHRDKPNFEKTVSLSVAPYAALQGVLNSLTRELDVDFAVGQQLDHVGEWAGASRFLRVPLADVYFTWDDVSSTGWDQGTWIGPFDPVSGLTRLPDDEYRLLIKAKIAANAWDSTIPGAYEVWETIFVNSYILIQDNQDMTMVVGIVGDISTITKALLTGGYIPIKPSTVAVSYYAVTEDGGPIFAWDSEDTPALKGWEQGSWASELAPTT